jgi:signal transduction histidine kinase
MRNQKPMVVPDMLHSKNISTTSLQKGRRSFIGVPLQNDSQVIGVLFVSDTQMREFTEQQVTRLATLANLTTNAIGRAKEYEETKRRVTATLDIAWMGMASSAWRHGIEGDALTLRTQIGNLHHELPESMHTPEVLKLLRGMERHVEEILVRPITPPLSEEESIESITVNDLLEERIKQWWENGKHSQVKYQINLQTTNGLTVRANAHWMRQVVDILVGNAIEAMANSEEKLLVVSTFQAGEEVVIRFTDTGCGVPEDVVGDLFHKQVLSSKGLGMGLLMANTIAQAYRGKIELVEPGPYNTTFILRFPVESATLD